jgi:hypothetical protein
LLQALTSDAELAKQQVQSSLRKYQQEMRDRFESDLFLFGFFQNETDYLSNNLRLYLFSSFSTKPDIREIRTDRNGELAAVVKQIDQTLLKPESLLRPYLGMTTVETDLPGHSLVVLRVDQASPAARVGIAEGDAIMGVNGQPASSSKINEWIDTHPVGTESQIEIEGVGGRKQLTVKTDPLPNLLVKSGSRDQTVLNALFVQLEFLRQTQRSDPSQTNIAMLNEALAHMEFGRWNDALETLKGFQDKASNASTLAPAVYYYRGYCWEQSGDVKNAAQEYDLAVKEPNKQLRSQFAFDFQTLSEWRRNSIR